MNKIPFDKNLYTKRIRVENIKPGDILAHDVYLKSGLLLANAGIALTEKHIEKLKQLDDKVVTLDMRQIYIKGVQISKKIFHDAADGKPVVVKDVEEFVKPFEEEIARETNVIRLLRSLQSKDEYTFQHTINIGVLVMLIGKWLEMDEQDTHKLMLAGTLHDIGKSKIPLSILNKPGSLTKEEFSIMKNHTIYGYEIMNKSSGFDENVKMAVLQHHERADGQGYPYGLKSDKVNLYAKIVAVADVYHAMTTTRVYRLKRNPYDVLEHLYKSIDTLDPKISLLFLDKMLCSLQSYKVLLNNGETGDVIYIDKAYISKPLIKLDNNKFIDLQKKDIAISEIIYEE